MSTQRSQSGPLSAELHRRAGELFDRLCHLPEEQREAGLEDSCGSDAELRTQVASLLAADREGPQFLDEPAIEVAARMLASATPVLPMVGNYRLERLIGSGGMGRVYEALDLKLNRRVAIKLLPPALAGDPERTFRFQQEARTVSLLNHPGIVSLYDAGFEGDQYYIATELVEGQTLRALSSAGPPDTKQLLDIAIQVSSALGAAHKAGIVHRDIKPDNIMVRRDGFVKILDFGVAKLVDGSNPADLQTRPGVIAGTVQYLSPEQVLGKTVTERSDLFSLGVVLYELATGVRPFDGGTDGAIFDAIANRPPAHPSQLRPAMGIELEAIVLRALEKDPEFRFQTAEDMAAALKRVDRTSDTAASPRIHPARPLRHGRKTLLMVGTCAALVTAAAIGTLAYFMRRPPVPSPARFDRLTDTPGEELFPTLSPDGRQFAYASAPRGNWDIYLKRTGGTTVVNLTKDSEDNDTQPAFSPDGSRIAFRSERNRGGLFIMESTGENPRRVSTRGYLPAWAPDGHRIVYSSESFVTPSNRGAPVSRLFILDTSNGSERQLPTRDAIQPTWSPHGYRIAYWGLRVGGQRDIFTVASSGQAQPLPVTDDVALDWSPVWDPSGKYLLYISNRGGTMNVWRVPIDEQSGRTLGPPEPLTLPALNVGGLSFSADGRSLIYTQLLQRNAFGSIPFDAARRAAAGPPEIVNSEHTVSNFGFSPNGSQMVVDTVGDASEDLWVVDLKLSAWRRITSDPYKNRAPQWSPDGKEILFLSDRAGRYEIWLIRPDGSGLRPLTEKSNPDMQRAIWSPDGHQILAGRSPGSPSFLDPATLQPVFNPAPAPGLQSEKDIYFGDWARGAGNGIAIGNQLKGHEQSEIVLYFPSRERVEHTGAVGRVPVWIQESSGSEPRNFLFARGADCFLYDESTKQERRLFSVKPNTLYALGIARDGRRIYFSQTVHEADLWLARFDLKN